MCDSFLPRGFGTAIFFTLYFFFQHLLSEAKGAERTRTQKGFFAEFAPPRFLKLDGERVLGAFFFSLPSPTPAFFVVLLILPVFFMDYFNKKVQ